MKHPDRVRSISSSYWNIPASLLGTEMV